MTPAGTPVFNKKKTDIDEMHSGRFNQLMHVSEITKSKRYCIIVLVNFFKGVPYLVPKISMFCALSQNH